MQDPSQIDREGGWDQAKARAKQVWGFLSDDDLDVAEGDFEALVSRIKTRTGETEEAVRELLDKGQRSQESNSW